MRILLVEDDRPLAGAVSEILKRSNYVVDTVHDGEDGLGYAMSDIYDLVILDIMLPKMDGLTVVRKLRERRSQVPVLMLTARGEVVDRVEGLNSGADDYLSKPFASDELRARVGALLRRRDHTLLEQQLAFGDLKLQNSTLKLSCGDREVQLTAREYELIQYLVLRMGVVTSKELILDKLWGYEGEVAVNNVEVYISFLRKKLSYLKSGVRIRTVRGLGYSLEALDAL